MTKPTSSRTQLIMALTFVSLIFAQNADAKRWTLRRAVKAAATGGASEIHEHVPPKALPPGARKLSEIEINADKTIDKAIADTQREANIAAGNVEETISKARKDFEHGAPVVGRQVRKALEKGVEDFGDTMAKTIDDTPQTLADFGTAIYHFAERQVKYEISAKRYKDFEKRVFEGKFADAVAHLGIDRFRQDELNAFKSAQESLLLRTVGQVAASVYGGPYGAAAYAAWYTYNSTGDMKMAIKAGLIAGATSYAMHAASGMSNVGAPQLAAKVIVTGAIAGGAAAASGGGKEDILKAVVMAGTSVGIEKVYQLTTDHPINPRGSDGTAWDKLSPKGLPGDSLDSPPQEWFFHDDKGNLLKTADGKYYRPDVTKFWGNRSMVGQAAAAGQHGWDLETSPIMKALSRIPVVNAGSLFHDVLSDEFAWKGFVLRATIAPCFVFTYYGTGAPTMELLMQDMLRAERSKNSHDQVNQMLLKSLKADVAASKKIRDAEVKQDLIDFANLKKDNKNQSSIRAARFAIQESEDGLLKMPGGTSRLWFSNANPNNQVNYVIGQFKNGTDNTPASTDRHLGLAIYDSSGKEIFRAHSVEMKDNELPSLEVGNHSLELTDESGLPVDGESISVTIESQSTVEKKTEDAFALQWLGPQ